MEEVRCLFKKRQYKNCSSRCIQLLEEIKDPTREHPLFITWVAFYAAAALEETSRSLNMNSSNKAPMLEQALSYYEKAQSYLELVPDRVPIVTRNLQQRSSSMSSSIHAPTEPAVSPTKAAGSSSSILSEYGPGYNKAGRPNLTNSSSNQTPDTASCTPQNSNAPQYFRAHSTTAHIHLYGMNVQLDYHINFTKEKLALLQKSRDSKGDTPISHYCSSGIDGIDMEAMRKAGWKARAEMLRGEGWKRKRFNGERYRTLCDKALAELE